MFWIRPRMAFCENNGMLMVTVSGAPVKLA
jgi:hypothetical protein